MQYHVWQVRGLRPWDLTPDDLRYGMPDVDKRGRRTAPKSGKWGGGTELTPHALDLTEIDAELLRDAVVAVCLEGDAIILGLTSDQGAAAVRILSNEGKEAFYAATTEALEFILRALRDRAKAL